MSMAAVAVLNCSSTGTFQMARPPAIETPTIVSVAVLQSKGIIHYHSNENKSNATLDYNRIALVLDATAQEEACADAVVHIALLRRRRRRGKGDQQNEKIGTKNDSTTTTTSDWVVTAIQKSMPGPLPLNLLPKIMAAALQGADVSSSSSSSSQHQGSCARTRNDASLSSVVVIIVENSPLYTTATRDVALAGTVFSTMMIEYQRTDTGF